MDQPDINILFARLCAIFKEKNGMPYRTKPEFDLQNLQALLDLGFTPAQIEERWLTSQSKEKQHRLKFLKGLRVDMTRSGVPASPVRVDHKADQLAAEEKEGWIRWSEESEERAAELLCAPADWMSDGSWERKVCRLAYEIRCDEECARVKELQKLGRWESEERLENARADRFKWYGLGWRHVHGVSGGYHPETCAECRMRGAVKI